MSRYVDRLAIGTLISLTCAASHAQTIGDYSRAQRALIESNIARNAARHGAAGPVELPVLPPAAASVPAQALSPALPPRPASVEPQVTVTGVIVTSTKALAEVWVDGVSYMLTAGQPVPGAPWTVSAVAANRVVLSNGRGARGSRTIVLASAGS